MDVVILVIKVTCIYVFLKISSITGPLWFSFTTGEIYNYFGGEYHLVCKRNRLCENNTFSFRKWLVDLPDPPWLQEP